MTKTNWAGNLTYSTEKIHYPGTLEQVQELVRRCPKIKALGSRHSFNPIADSSHNLISLQALNRVVHLDQVNHTVTVEGGMRYGELAPFLQGHGYALPNLASLPHISVAGACATATHGSGLNQGNLATAVSALEFVNATGELVSLSRKTDGADFAGAVVNLGALGIITQLTLNLQPTFSMKQVVYRNLPMRVLKDNFPEIMASGYSVSLFTTWQQENINQVWIKSLVDARKSGSAADFYGAKPATEHLHPLEELSPENATDQLGIPGFWYERLPHFKMGFVPSAGKELQSEYFVPLGQAYDALAAVARLQEKIGPYLFVSEIRAIAADDLWMSPCYGNAKIAFHFTWKQEREVLEICLPLIEAALAPFGALPHWGKLFTTAPEVVQAGYSKLPDFKNLIWRYDPEGKFRNDFLAELLYPNSRF